MNVEDHLKDLSLEEIREQYIESALPYAVACLNVTGDLNVGMIIRTACVFGAQKVVVLGRRKYDKRTTVGAYHYIPVDRIDCMEEGELNYMMAYQRLREMGYHVIAVDQPREGFESKDILDFKFNLFSLSGREKSTRQGLEIPIPCFVFGNEGDGIPDEFMKLAQLRVHIQQHGILRSLNVATAASIVIHTAFKEINQ